MAAFSHTSYCFFLWAAFMITCTFSAPAPVAEGDLSQTQALDYNIDSGSTRCYYNFQHYEEGDRIVTNEPCLNCTCHKRMLMCYLRVCPFTKAIGQDCTVEKKPDQCCPVITCPQVPVDILTSSTTEAVPYSAIGHLSNYGCTLEDNSFYPDGAQVPSDPKKPCELCYCIRNQTACVMQECTLHVKDCRPVHQEGICCPTRYECDYDTEIGTTHQPTTGGLLLGTTASPLQCRYGDTLYNDGELIDSEKPCESCYCMRGDIVCAVRSCGEPLEGSDCDPLPPPEGQCCPTTYKCANGTFPVEKLVTQSSLVMNPADSQTNEATDGPKQDQPVTTESIVEEFNPEKPVQHEGGVLSSEQPTEEENEHEKNIEDEQTDITGDHVESDPTDAEELDDELSPAVEADDIVESDNTHLATNSPLLTSEHQTTAKLDAAVVDPSQGEMNTQEAASGSGEGSDVDINQSAIPSEAEPKPEGGDENTEAGSGEEPSATESGSESHEESDNVVQAQDSTEKEESIHSKPDENKDELAANEQDNVNQDEVTETTEGHNEQKPSPSDENSIETEQDSTELEQNKPADPLSESEGEPDNVDQSTDLSVQEHESKPEVESATENDDNILIHEESAPSVPSTPEALDQTQESDDSSQSGSDVVSGLSDSKDKDEDPNNEENLIHEESASTIPSSSGPLDQTHQSENSGQSDSEIATVLPIDNNNAEVPTNDDTKETPSLVEDVHDDSNLNVQEGIEAHTGSFQKDPIPPRRDDAAPEELDQHLKHPEGSMTKAEDSIPDDQTQATFSESKQPDNTESITDEEISIPTSSTTDMKEPTLEGTNTNTENVDASSENSDKHSVSEDYPIHQQEPQEPITESNEEVVNAEEQKVSSISNVVSEEIEIDSIPNDKKPEENVQVEPLTPVESDENKANENGLNIDTTEQDSATDKIITEEIESVDPIKESTQETSIAHEGQEEISGDVTDPATNNYSDENISESTLEPLKEENAEETTEQSNSQQVAEISNPTSSNSVSNDDSLVSTDENVESSTKVSYAAEEEPPVTTGEHAEAAIQSIESNQAQETSVPEDSGVDPEGINSEESSSESSPNYESVDLEDVHTEPPEKELENESDESSNLGPGAQSDKSESEKVDADESSLQPEITETSESHTSSSAPENLHEDTNADESELQEVPHDPVESDPTEFEDDEVEHESPSENEIVDENLSGNGGSIEHDTTVGIPGPIGVIPGEGDCLVDGQTFTNNSLIPSKSPCHKECTCLSSIVHCRGIDCPPPPPELANCMPVHQGDLCCPVYTCDGDTPEGPESHNQIGGVDESLGEEHTSSASEAGSDSERPSDTTSSNLVDPQSEEKQPSAETPEQSTGVEAVVEDSTQDVESETQSSVDAAESNGPVQSQPDDVSNDTKNQPNVEGSSDSTENESTVSTDSEITHEDPKNEDNDNLIQTTDVTPTGIHNEKTTSDTVSKDQDKPAESSEENSGTQHIPDGNTEVDTPIKNNDVFEQQSIVTDESEGNSDAANNQDPTGVKSDELPTPPEAIIESGEPKPSEEDASKSGTENNDESQPSSLDEDHNTNTNSEIVTEASSKIDNFGSTEVSATDNSDGSSSVRPENDDGLSEENNHTVNSEDHSVEGEAETVHDTVSSIDETQNTPEQENEATVSEQETQTTLTTEEVNRPSSEEIDQTNKDNGASDVSIVDVDVGEKISDSSEISEGNNLTPLANSDESSQDINAENANVNHENVSDTKDPSEEDPKQNIDGSDETNASTENVATTSPLDDQIISQTHKVTDEPSQSSNSDDEHIMTEIPEKTVDPSSSQSLSEDEIVPPDATENSSSAIPSVGEVDKEESSDVVEETSHVNDNNEEVNEDESTETTHTPIIEEQGLNVVQTTEKQPTEDNDSNDLATEANQVENSESVKDHQAEITEEIHAETETAVPYTGSSDGASDNILQNNSETFAHDNVEESNIQNEQTTEGYDSSGTEKPTAEVEHSSLTHVESTKQPERDEDPISTQGYNEILQSPESDSLKIGEDSEKLQLTGQEHDTTHELDSSSIVSSNTDTVVTTEVDENKPVSEISESDDHGSQPEHADQLPSETSETDEASQSNQNNDHVEQLANTPEHSVGSEKTSGTTIQSIKIDAESDETNQGEETQSQGESENTVQESNPSSVENEPEVEGAHDIELDHNEEGTETTDEDTSVNELITTAPEIEGHKEEDITEYEVKPSAQDGDSVSANTDGNTAQEDEHTDHVSDHVDQAVEQPAQDIQQPALETEQPAQEDKKPAQDIVQPAQEVNQPAQEVNQPAQEVAQPAEEIKQPGQEVEQSVPGEEPTIQAIGDPAQEGEQPVLEVEQSAQEGEQPTQAVVDPVLEVDQTAQEVEQPAEEDEQPIQAVEGPAQEDEQPAQEPEQSTQEGEQPIQPVEDPDQEGEQPGQEIQQHTQDVDQPAQETEQPAEEVETPAQEVVQPEQEVNHPAPEVEQPAQEVTQPAEDIELPGQEVESPAQEVGHTDQEDEHVDQVVEQTTQVVEQPIQEADHTDHESEHVAEHPTQESEHPEHHSEESTHEIDDHSHVSSQSQDSSSLPIPSEETHTVEDELKPDISKPDDSEIPAEDQFPSSPDMDYDGSEDGAFGPGTCRYGGKVYVSAQQIPRDDPCDFCFCFRSDIICLQQSCPPPIHRCHQEPIQGYCCPRYQCPVSMATSLNLTTTTTTTTTTLPPHFFPHAYLGAARQAGCLHKGRAFSVGQEITTASGPCLHCICGADGQMRCDPVVCSPEPQLRRMMEAAISHRRR